MPMLRVKILIPCRVGDKLYEPSEKEVKLPKDKVASLLSINCNMLIVLGEVKKPSKKN